MEAKRPSCWEAVEARPNCWEAVEAKGPSCWEAVEARPSCWEAVEAKRPTCWEAVEAQRGPACPVAPLLAPVDELRAPSAGSLAAGRPADGFIPEASDIAAAAARALEAGSRPGAAATDEDHESDVEEGTPPFGVGRLGVGPPSIAYE